MPGWAGDLEKDRRDDMFAYIKGRLEEVFSNKVVVDVGGIGYEIIVPSSLISRLPEQGSIVKLHTYLNVREDAQELYGFYGRDDKSIFEKLITVSGIGPKVAIGLLSALSASQLAAAIVTGDIKTLCTAPGIGKKTAQRIVLELKEKIDKEEIDQRSEVEIPGTVKDNTHEVIQALIALGYKSSEAMEALASIEDKNQDVSTLIRLCLKSLDKR